MDRIHNNTFPYNFRCIYILWNDRDRKLDHGPNSFGMEVWKNGLVKIPWIDPIDISPDLLHVIDKTIG
jgi:hypothetical protein